MPTITDLGYNQKTKEKRSQTLSAMKERIKYIYDKSDIKSGMNLNIGSVDKIYKEFISIKELYNKFSGNNFFHYVVSFSNNDDITYEQGMEIVEKFLEDKKFESFQIFYGIHQDTDNIHCHLLINSVSIDNGKKWHISNNEWIPLQVKLNTIALPYGCEIPDKILKAMNINQEKIKNTTKSKEEKNSYEKEMRASNKSWKKIVKNNIDYIIKNSVSTDEFYKSIKDIGYSIYKNNDNKLIISIPKINKKISLDKLDIIESDLFDRISFNSSLNENDLNDMKENLSSFIKSHRTYDNDNLKKKYDNYDYTKNDDQNKKVYYKDLVADIKKFIVQNKNITNTMELQLAYILKYSLNTSTHIDEVLEKIKQLEINAELNNGNNIILDFGGLKISSSYLKIDINKELNNKVSWKYDMYLSIKNAKKLATSREDFINILKNKGIYTKWEDTHKHITFTDSLGNKRRNNKFYPEEDFTKENLEKYFEKNVIKAEKEKYYQDKKYVKNTIYDTLKTASTFNAFEKMLQRKQINITKYKQDDEEKIRFEYNNTFFQKDEHFQFDKERIDASLQNNLLNNFFSANAILNIISSANRGKNNNDLSNKLSNSKIGMNDYLSELKKGKNLDDKARQR